MKLSSSNLKSTKIKLLLPFSLSLILISCYSNTIITSNLELSFPEQKNMETRIIRYSDNYYTTNLKLFKQPTEKQLVEEAKFSNQKLYNENINILSDWVLKSLSPREKLQLSKNCAILVGKYKNEFPLNEQTLACAGWWLERKNSEDVSFSKQQQNTISMPKATSTEKSRLSHFMNLSFADAFTQIEVSSINQARYYTNLALSTGSDCSYKGFRSAVIIRWEAFLPNEEAFRNIEKLYARSENCLIPNADGAEKTHMRVGLLRLLSGKTHLAEKSLLKVQQENDPQENIKSLFWLGTIYQAKHKDSKENPYWESLIKESPTSLAAIVAAQHMSKDPLNNFVDDESISIENREFGGWNSHNLEAFVFDFFKAKNMISSAKGWASFVGKTTTVTNPKLALYWALVENSVQNYHESIVLYGRYVKYEKSAPISKTLLKLQYPVAYLYEILNNTSEVDPIFILALIRQESAFDPLAHSNADARGLMQVLPSTARSLKNINRAESLYVPDKNIEVGSTHLKTLLRKYNGQMEYVLAAYNAGPINLEKWKNRVSNSNIMLFSDYIPFKETRSYISIILRNYYWYSRILSEENTPAAQKMIQNSMKSVWKPANILALINANRKFSLSESEKTLLNKIYIFGATAQAADDKADILETSLR